MKIKFCIGLFALALAYGCSAKKAAAPDPVAAAPVIEKLAVSSETLAEGKSLYGMNCAKCHKLFDANDFTAEEWTPIVIRMQKKAKITDEQRDKIYAYLTTPKM